MALTHVKELEWIEQDDGLETDFGKLIVRDFLIQSPALEVTARSRGWINRFGIKDSDDVEVLFDSLAEKVKILKSNGRRYASSADEVESLLEKDGLKSGNFWSHGSFAVYTVPNEAKTQVANAVSSSVATNNSLKEEKKKKVRDKYLQVDALFRHIRNAIAHGSYQIKTLEKRKRIVIFQDASVQGLVSARIVLSEEVVHEWDAFFRRLEQNGI